MYVENLKIYSLVNVIKEATLEVLKVYNSKDFQISAKEDESPLTIADEKSHNIIVKRLNELTPDIPILSEEGKSINYNDRKKWEYFWMIDPLDGTKEFIKKNGEFTINIALIKNGKPVIGIVSVPVKDEVFFAVFNKGAYKISSFSKYNLNREDELYYRAKKLPFQIERSKIMVVGSRSHRDKNTDEFIESLKRYGEIEIIAVGSSYKLCCLAEGIADIYPRFGKTMEWDIAGGHIILEEAGGKIINALTGNDIIYNKENLENPPFIAKGFYFRKRYE